MTRAERNRIAVFCREQGIAWHAYGENVIIEYELSTDKVARWINSHIVTGFDHLVATLQSLADRPSIY